MARRDGDTWGVTQGVGATALGVALARAVESRRPDALFRDPYAELFLRAAHGEAKDVVSGPMAERISSIGDYAASRTRWFDDFFVSAARAGIRQAVILGAGLDARAYRLPWADGTVVYEIDQPAVLHFKAETLADRGVVPHGGTSVHVHADLRDDWPTALLDAGFDASAPAAWSAEGLLPYLPATGQDLLFERITELGAPGGRIAVEAFGRDFFDPEHLAQRREQMQRLREEARQAGEDTPDIEDLWYFEERADVATWLAARGWEVTSIDWHELLQRYRPGTLQRAPRTVYVDGVRN